MITLRRLTPDDWRDWRMVRLRALEQAPYAFGSTLAYWQGEGDTEARWRGRLTDVPLNLIAELSGESVGQASGAGTDLPGRVELISMWVAPEARGEGIADALIEAVVDWATREQAADEVVLWVRQANAYAITLYERHGFRPTTTPVHEDEQEMSLRIGQPGHRLPQGDT